jgi:hypothetical protein
VYWKLQLIRRVPFAPLPGFERSRFVASSPAPPNAMLEFPNPHGARTS